MHHSNGQVQNQPIHHHVNRWTPGLSLEYETEKTKFKGRNFNGLGASPNRNVTKSVRQSYNRAKKDQSYTRNLKKLDSSEPLDKEFFSGDVSSSLRLLNFHYSSPSSNSMQKNQSSNYRKKRIATFNKEVFLQSNCYFVVDNVPDKYLVNGVDPDVLVAWETIRLVYLPTHEIPSCPICLYPPTVAKITRCGHVFCWSCILHYLQLTDKTWRKCPICHEAVHDADLKSVVNVIQKKFARHENITMKLMKRQKSSLFTSTKSEKISDESFSLWNGLFLKFGSKLMLANKDSVVEKIMLPEKLELENQLIQAVADESGEDCFIQLALMKVKKAIEEIKIDNELIETLNMTHTVDDNDAFVPSQESSLAFILSQAKVDDSYELPFANNDSENKFENTNTIKENLDHQVSLQWNNGADEQLSCNAKPSNILIDEHVEHYVNKSSERFDDFYYFYQAEDGQNIYIDALNARCLIEEYGSLCNAPTTITGQILDFESFTMSLEHRKRFRYLSHLPLACEFCICELLLRPPVLSKSTIHNFMPEFNKRKSIRSKKLEEQRKFDRKATNARNKEFGYQCVDDCPTSNIDLADLDNFPCSFSPTTELTHQNSFYNEAAADENNGLGKPGLSFAQMLKVKQPDDAMFQKPSIHLTNTQLTNKNDTRNLTVLQDNECEISTPTFKEMFNAAISATTLKCLDPTQENNSKKKKQKGILLFSTGAQRKY
ncbi:E3 ubiquitin-protein ligase RNF10 isoform X3 [Hydra vulgaris]|uniref:E3 ubiquitin-protein ligase RNF10 isoform X3 n=1 Tax=Hydra vulgaris TaxID=6087 RepID=UPI001F5FA40F|nr:RING finger protein 10 isoform X3 [Hydra vulgaris]